MQISQFLNIWDIWVNELVGDIWLFIFLGIIMIWFLSVKQKMTTESTFILTLLFLSAIFARTYFEIIWVLIVFGVGAFFYYKLQKIIRRG